MARATRASARPAESETRSQRSTLTEERPLESHVNSPLGSVGSLAGTFVRLSALDGIIEALELTSRC